MAFDLVAKAQSFGIKVWNITKLSSVLDRCLESTSVSTSVSRAKTSTASLAAPNPQRALSRLLQSERIHGTSERDPTQKRNDFKYFARGSYFVLVEDIRQQLATITTQEYRFTAPKGRDAGKPPWPVLYCHPKARGPFIAFDQKEKNRFERAQQLEKEQEGERERKHRNQMKRAEAMKRRAEAKLHACKQSGDLRRSVSMSNLNRRATYPGLPDPELVDLDGDTLESANASGYLVEGGYMAASGNSVGVTSTTGTTSTTGYTFQTSMLPPSLRSRPHFLTSRKFPTAIDKTKNNGTMGPPVGIPERLPMLKKSRSTNTMRLPKREEGSKPGYCESCRVKFEDFGKVLWTFLPSKCIHLPSLFFQHVIGRKHRKFAIDDANFFQLDFVLARVERRTKEDVLQEQMQRDARRRGDRHSSDDGANESGHCQLRESSLGHGEFDDDAVMHGSRLVDLDD